MKFFLEKTTTCHNRFFFTLELSTLICQKIKRTSIYVHISSKKNSYHRSTTCFTSECVTRNKREDADKHLAKLSKVVVLTLFTKRHLCSSTTTLNNFLLRLTHFSRTKWIKKGNDERIGTQAHQNQRGMCWLITMTKKKKVNKCYSSSFNFQSDEIDLIWRIKVDISSRCTPKRRKVYYTSLLF